ncbi:MAG: hypothetical protein Aureis2KO_01530 [Aureisphaera sp.]
MKNRILVLFLSITTLVSCSKDTNSTENFTDPTTTNLRASNYTSDPNFLTLVDNYSALAEKIWFGADDYKEPPGNLNTEVVLLMAGFSKLEEFRAFQRENSELYYRIVADYNLESKVQLQELSSKLVDKSKDELLTRYPRMKSCAWTMFGCLIDAVVSFAEDLDDIGGIGCEWNPGSECWEAMLTLEADALWTMQGCIESYLEC